MTKRTTTIQMIQGTLWGAARGVVTQQAVQRSQQAAALLLSAGSALRGPCHQQHHVGQEAQLPCSFLHTSSVMVTPHCHSLGMLWHARKHCGSSWTDMTGILASMQLHCPHASSQDHATPSRQWELTSCQSFVWLG